MATRRAGGVSQQPDTSAGIAETARRPGVASPV